jgi:hypothetical protein
MLLPILLAASIQPAPQVSMRCVDGGANIPTAQTESLRGPQGVAVVLKVSSADDHSKDTHLCNADYQLLVTPADRGAAVPVDLLSTDDDWDRTLSLILSGFGHDGKRVFGMLLENGHYPAVVLFAYNIDDGQVQLIDLKKQFAHVLPPSCNPTFDVVGTTVAGAIVVALNSNNSCKVDGRWQIDPTGSSAHRLPPGASVENLFEARIN